MDYYHDLLFCEDEAVPDKQDINTLWADYFNTSPSELENLKSMLPAIDHGDSLQWIINRNGNLYSLTYGPEPAYSVHLVKDDEIGMLRKRAALTKILDNLSDCYLESLIRLLMPLLRIDPARLQ